MEVRVEAQVVVVVWLSPLMSLVVRCCVLGCRLVYHYSTEIIIASKITESKIPLPLDTVETKILKIRNNLEMGLFLLRFLFKIF